MLQVSITAQNISAGSNISEILSDSLTIDDEDTKDNVTTTTTDDHRRPRRPAGGTCLWPMLQR